MAVLVNISFSVDGNAFAYHEGFREQILFQIHQKSEAPFL
jgi:hypothetical protein